MHWPTLANTLAGLLLLGQGAASIVNAADPRPLLGRAYNGVLDGGNSSSFSLVRRQGSSPQCGAAANGARCTNDLCCSQWGYCGSSDLYCSNYFDHLCDLDNDDEQLDDVYCDDDNFIDDRYNQLLYHEQQQQQQQQQHSEPDGGPPTRPDRHHGRHMWQQQILSGMDLRTMLLAVRLLRIGGHILFPDRGLPGRVRYMRWIVIDHARCAIDNIHFNVNEQLIFFFGCHDDDDFGHHQHQLYE